MVVNPRLERAAEILESSTSWLDVPLPRTPSLRELAEESLARVADAVQLLAGSELPCGDIYEAVVGRDAVDALRRGAPSMARRAMRDHVRSCEAC